MWVGHGQRHGQGPRRWGGNKERVTGAGVWVHGEGHDRGVVVDLSMCMHCHLGVATVRCVLCMHAL